MKHIRRVEHPAEEHLDDMDASEKTPASRNENKSDEMKLKVFIADDSTEIRNRLKEMFTENESICLIGESGNAEDSISAIRHLKPDAVILDIHMPGGGGMRVLRDIHQMDSERVVIIFTAFPYPQYRRVYLTAGADYFFDKTNDAQKMMDVLVELAQQHVVNRNNEDLDQEGNKAE